ncbi:MAG TPA: hypothetical protein VIL36_01565 [Acidimicrobiales bacterium]
MRGSRWTAAPAVTIAVAVALAAGACGSGPGDASDGDTRGTDDIAGVEPGARETGDAADDLRAELEDLLARHDTVTSRIMADPSVVHDAGSALVDEYLDLFEPGSEQTANALARWAERADSGTSVESTDPDVPAISYRLDEDELPAPDGDEVTFRICSVERYVVYGPGGDVEDMVDNPGTPGTATAVRVDGEWRLRSIDVVFNGSFCRDDPDDDPTEDPADDGGSDESEAR